MLATMLVVLPFLLVLCQTNVINAELNLRITNGTNVKEKNFPFMVAIRKNGKHQCGGTILNKNHILTAAHCVNDVPIRSLSVIAGKICINQRKSISGINICGKKIHKQYQNNSPYPNDIAILRLCKNLEYGPTIKPVQLPPRHWVTPVGLDVIAIGWGKDENSENQNRLKKATLTAISMQECSKTYQELSNLHHQCVAPKKGQTTCNGDSGGPLFHAKKKFQIGITSSGDEFCRNDPSVFTNIVNYLRWIKENEDF